MIDNKKEIQGFKAFNKDFKCLDFQYEIGKTYIEVDNISICKKGFHFCEMPFDIFTFYPIDSRFAQVMGYSNFQKENNKICAKSIEIKKEIDLKSLIEFQVKFVLANAATTGERANAATTGYGANAATTGERANAATTGNWANAATTGNWANAATTGEKSIAAGLGYNNKAKANLNSWIVLSEYFCANNSFEIRTIKCTKVDGIIIKANTWYKLENETFVECSDEN
jgi:hypothetical protein